MATNGETDSHTTSPTCSIDEFTSTSFDYLICGGGTAGLTIAARLTENPDVTVGVIEAGKCKLGDPLVDTPAAFPQMFEKPEYDWCHYTAPQAGFFSTSRQPTSISSAADAWPTAREPWQGPSHAAWEASRRLKWYQLYDVRARLAAGLRRLGGLGW